MQSQLILIAICIYITRLYKSYIYNIYIIYDLVNLKNFEQGIKLFLFNLVPLLPKSIPSFKNFFLMPSGNSLNLLP